MWDIAVYVEKKKLVFKWKKGKDWFTNDIEVYIPIEEWEFLKKDLKANNGLGMIEIGDEIYNKKEFRFSGDVSVVKWSIEEFIYSQWPDIREKLFMREKQKKGLVWRGWESIWEVVRYIERIERGEV